MPQGAPSGYGRSGHTRRASSRRRKIGLSTGPAPGSQRPIPPASAGRPGHPTPARTTRTAGAPAWLCSATPTPAWAPAGRHRASAPAGPWCAAACAAGPGRSPASRPPAATPRAAPWSQRRQRTWRQRTRRRRSWRRPGRQRSRLRDERHGPRRRGVPLHGEAAEALRHGQVAAGRAGEGEQPERRDRDEAVRPPSVPVARHPVAEGAQAGGRHVGVAVARGVGLAGAGAQVVAQGAPGARHLPSRVAQDAHRRHLSDAGAGAGAPWGRPGPRGSAVAGPGNAGGRGMRW
jgi:hypothetical protein